MAADEAVDPAEAARMAAEEAGREQVHYTVSGSPLVHNGRAYNDGDTIELARADGDILAAAGRVQSVDAPRLNDTTVENAVDTVVDAPTPPKAATKAKARKAR